MTREELLKTCILDHYKTVKDFAVAIGLPYTTVDGIMRRGVMNARVENMIRICEHLGISLDALIDGKLKPRNITPSITMQDASVLDKYRNLPASDKETVDFLLDRQERDKNVRPG